MKILPYFFSLLLAVIILDSGVVLGQGDTLLAQKKYQEGDTFFKKSSYEEAYKLYSDAEAIFEKAGKTIYYLNCLNQEAEILSRQEKYQEGIEIVSKGLKINHEKLPKNNLQEADGLNILGFLQLNIGRNDLALDNFKKASKIYAGLYKGNEAKVALCYNNLGLVYWSRGDFSLAQEYLDKSLSLRKEIFGELSEEVAASYNNKGLIYVAIDPAVALSNYEKALSIYQQLYDEQHPSIAIAYTNIAVLDRADKKYETALINFNKALQIYQSLYGENSPKTAFIYSNIGLVYAAKSENTKSLEFQDKALQIYLGIYGKKHQNIASTYNSIGSVYVEMGDYPAALGNYQKAICANIPDFNELDYTKNPVDITQYYNGDILLNSLFLKAGVMEQIYISKSLKLKDIEFASNTLALCEALIENIRILKTNKNDKLALGEIASEVFETYIRICLTLADVSLDKKTYREKAFELSEKSKSAVLLSSIADIDAKQFANIPADLIEQEKQFKIDITFFEQEIAKGLKPEQEKKYRDQLFEKNRQYDEFIRTLEAQYPAYYNLKFSKNIVSVEEMQGVLDNETAVISYFIGDKSRRLYIFELTKQGLNIFDVPLIEKFNAYLTAFRNSIYRNIQKQYQILGFTLYKQLFPGTVGQGKDRLVIIPDGRLGVIPFEALFTEKTKEDEEDIVHFPYLINQKMISYHFSATLFQQTVLKNNANPNNTSNIFLCAPINFAKQNALPGTEEEVLNIRDIFVNKALEAKLYTFLNAKESMVKSGELKKYKFLHFATHGLVNEDIPEMSHILLAIDNNPKEDGNLYAGEIYNLELKADLVALSACQTGLGKISKGEGVIGLSRAFLYAGAKNLLVSYWSVADASTSRLMIDFYKNLLSNLENPDYGSSLRNAKLKMIAGERYASPYYWSAFVLIGK